MSNNIEIIRLSTGESFDPKDVERADFYARGAVIARDRDDKPMTESDDRLTVRLKDDGRILTVSGEHASKDAEQVEAAKIIVSRKFPPPKKSN
jgi:hypothetical protein